MPKKGYRQALLSEHQVFQLDLLASLSPFCAVHGRHTHVGHDHIKGPSGQQTEGLLSALRKSDGSEASLSFILSNRARQLGVKLSNWREKATRSGPLCFIVRGYSVHDLVN